MGCGEIFMFRTGDKRHKNKFCSSRCALAAVRTRLHQVKAGKAAGKVIIAKYRGTGIGYIKEFSQHQHRNIMEKKLGRKLHKGEIVHHKDHNKKNNDPDNLEVMTQGQHALLHYRLSDGSAIRKATLANTKYGPKCRWRNCKLGNKIGHPYCAHHIWINKKLNG